jgi:hypothetical protein
VPGAGNAAKFDCHASKRAHAPEVLLPCVQHQPHDHKIKEIEVHEEPFLKLRGAIRSFIVRMEVEMLMYRLRGLFGIFCTSGVIVNDTCVAISPM